MLNCHPGMAGVHRNCKSRDVFLVFEEEDSTGSHLNPPLLFVSRANGIPYSHT